MVESHLFSVLIPSLLFEGKKKMRFTADACRRFANFGPFIKFSAATLLPYPPSRREHPLECESGAGR